MAKKSQKLDDSKDQPVKTGFDSSKNLVRPFDTSLPLARGSSNQVKVQEATGAVTGEVTKRNGSADSQTSEREALQDEKLYKSKKDKKKKKNKRSSDKHKRKMLFPFYPSMVDDVVAQYDFFQSHMGVSSKFPLPSDFMGTASSKHPSKIYPGFNELMSSKNKAGKDGMMFGGTQMPPYHSNFPMPFPSFMFHPAYISQFMPFMNPQQSMEAMMNNPYFKQLMKSHAKSGSKPEPPKGDKVSKQNSSEKQDKDSQDEDKKSKTDKEKAEEFMMEMMNHYFQMNPAMQAYYHKAGGFPFPFGMPPHPGFFHHMPMPGMPPVGSSTRDKHHSSAYHKQFTMPITPNNLQSQVFGEKAFLAEPTKGAPKKTSGLHESDNEKKDEQAVSKNERHPQYNSNITVLINQYGHFNRPDVVDGENTKKSKTETAQESIQNLMTSKQSSTKKQPDQVGGTTSANFK